jgi:hypothetical protein
MYIVIFLIALLITHRSTPQPQQRTPNVSGHRCSLSFSLLTYE